MNVGKQVAKGKFQKTGFDKNALVKHGVILGATGSGKTGLGIGLLEQLAMEGVPVIAIDPKGDLGNILDVPMMGITVATDFETSREPDNRDLELRKDIQRRAKLKSVDASVYTPGVLEGESGGKPLGIYGNSKESHSEWLRQVLSLAYGYEIGVLDTKFVFLENEQKIAEEFKDSLTTVDDLIRVCLNPESICGMIGQMTLDEFMPESERKALARKLTSLNESRDFKRWTNGELNISSLLWGAKSTWNENYDPRLSIISIAHLSEADRKFFLPIFLSELVSTMRKWQGTDKLRAVLYIDECVGMLPPVSTPPTKNWLMTLLKQARAYGLGVVLATQNPADIDYKALGNVGSWWIGRLQTDLDRKKVGEAVRASDGGVNLGSLLGNLEARQFVQSVNGSNPILVKSNDCLSRLSGPMTLPQIKERMEWRSIQRVEWQRRESEEKTYRRMLVAGAKCATYGMSDELSELEYLGGFIPDTEGFLGLPRFLWRESVKPVLKARLRMVQDDLMKAYVVNAKAKIRKEKQVG